MAREKNQIYAWIYIFGSPDEIGIYSTKIWIKSQRLKESFGGGIHTLDKAFKNIIADEDCFVISQKKATRFLENGKLNINFRLTNLKEEVKDADEESGISDIDN